MRVAINGYGRIGRAIMRAWIESTAYKDIEIVAVNTLGSDLKVNAHLSVFDSIHGKLNADVVQLDNNRLSINGHIINFSAIDNPEHLPWGELAVDLVLECTGVFTAYDHALKHINNSGAKRVLLSAPGKGKVDATIVYGLNHNTIVSDMKIISNGSCTTNCLAPIAKILDDYCGIAAGFMTTVHSYTQDQQLLDSYHSDVTRSRAGALSIVPTKTHAIEAVVAVVPQLKGKLDGLAVRVPVPNVSLVDFTFTSKIPTTPDGINELFIDKSNNSTWHNIVGYSHDRCVSIDFNHNSHSAIIDLTQTRVINDTLVKVLGWYDNEWGFANRMLDIANVIANVV